MRTMPAISATSAHAAPHFLPLLLFALTYVGLAVGRIPGLALDRTGFALLGAVAFLAAGEVSLDDAKQAVDTGTLAVLFGMMILSALYQQSGLYAAIGRRLARTEKPRRLLLGALLVAILVSAGLRGDFYLPQLDSPLRFCLALPVLWFVIHARVDAARLFQYLLPAALALTLASRAT